MKFFYLAAFLATSFQAAFAGALKCGDETQFVVIDLSAKKIEIKHQQLGAKAPIHFSQATECEYIEISTNEKNWFGQMKVRRAVSCAVGGNANSAPSLQSWFLVDEKGNLDDDFAQVNISNVYSGPYDQCKVIGSTKEFRKQVKAVRETSECNSLSQFLTNQEGAFRNELENNPTFRERVQNCNNKYRFNIWPETKACFQPHFHGCDC